MKHLLTPDAARDLRQAPVGEGWLVLHLSPMTLYAVRVVYRDGALYRCEDEMPVFPLTLVPEEDTSVPF